MWHLQQAIIRLNKLVYTVVLVLYVHVPTKILITVQHTYFHLLPE